MPALRFFGMAIFVGSVIAGVPLTYQRGHVAEPPLIRVTPASPELMQLLRDEHALAQDMLKAQNARGH